MIYFLHLNDLAERKALDMDNDVRKKAGILDDLTMKYEVAVQALFEKDYLKEFCDFYEIKNRSAKLIDSPDPWHDALKELSGDDVWRHIAGDTEYLFGEPDRVRIFDDVGKLTDELEGPDGLAPFFFVFDIMFCEYDGFTLCFMSGTNN